MPLRAVRASLQSHIDVRVRQEDDRHSVASLLGSIHIAFKLPVLTVRVVTDHDLDTFGQAGTECIEVAIVIHAKPPRVEDVLAVDVEEIVSRVNPSSAAGEPARESALAAAGDATHDVRDLH